MRINKQCQLPVTMTEVAPGVWQADFGRDAFGWLEVELPESRQETWVALGEVRGDDGRIVVQPGGYRIGIVLDVMTRPGRHWYPVKMPGHLSPYQPAQANAPRRGPVIRGRNGRPMRIDLNALRNFKAPEIPLWQGRRGR